MPHPFIPVPNAASIEMVYLSNGQTVENQLHVKKGSPYSLTDLQDVRAIVNGWDASIWSSTRANAVTLNRIRTRALDSSAAPMEDWSLPTPRGGGYSSAAAPNNVTFAVKLGTGLAGRSFRGRLYVTGIALAALDANTNVLNPIVVAFYVSALNTLLTSLASGGHALGVVSYMTGRAWRTEGLFTPGVSWSAVNNNIDSQRRRLTGRGS